MTIDSKTLAEVLQLGGQYMLPIAALLRALYSGVRGKLPEGFTQIGAAAVFAGITAAVGEGPIDLRTIVADSAFRKALSLAGEGDAILYL